MPKKCVILGAGGHARVVIDSLQTAELVELVGILDPNPDLLGKDIFGVPIIGNDDILAELHSKGVDYFVIGLGGTGNNRPRIHLFDLACTNGLKPLTVYHPSAIISSRAEIGEGTQLLPGCIVNANARIGKNCILNSGSIVEHDCTIGNHVHIATGAKLASTVTIGEGAHIGAGATIRQCIEIGEFAVVGAGSVVIRDVLSNITVVGVPANHIK